MAAIARGVVTIVRADTGSGKTTRVPLFIRNHHRRSQTEAPRILMTQPRRVATICAARRLAQSLGQQLDGQDGGDASSRGLGARGGSPHCEVGYMIRGQSGGAHSSVARLAVCTTGWLLHRVRSDPNFLGKWNYIILDEVHERAIEADLLALICKDALLSAQTQCRDLKLVIMSATVEAELFTRYFAAPLVALAKQCFIKSVATHNTGTLTRSRHSKTKSVAAPPVGSCFGCIFDLFFPPGVAVPASGAGVPEARPSRPGSSLSLPRPETVDVKVLTHRKFALFLDDLVSREALQSELRRPDPASAEQGLSRLGSEATAVGRQTQLPPELRSAVEQLQFKQATLGGLAKLLAVPAQMRL